VWIDPPPQLPLVEAPTLGMWGSRDGAVTESQMRDSGSFVTGRWRYERADGAGHWLQLERPETVKQLLLDFLPRGSRVCRSADS
jgi:pimeloyl-ACP methyl ester carboxylesterase